MQRPRVAVVSRDPETRFRAAQAFDEAPRDWLVSLFDAAPADADVIVAAPDVDVPGIDLDIENPARTIAAVRERLRRRRDGTVIAVASVCGGSGCTSVALHLAAYLSSDRPALYVERRASCGGRYRLGLGLGGPDWDGVEEAEQLESNALPIAGGLRALLAPTDGRSLPVNVLTWCRERAEHVVLDCGVVDDPESVWLPDSVPILVLRPAVPDVRRAADVLTKIERPPLIISNRLGPGSEFTREMLVRILGNEPAIELPCSPLLRDAEDEGRLLGVQASAWSLRVARVAAAIKR